MPRKHLKKEINDTLGALIEEVYVKELSAPELDPKKSEKIIDEAIALFDDLIQQINSVKGDDVKAQFKKIQETKAKVMKDLLKKSAKL